MTTWLDRILLACCLVAMTMCSMHRAEAADQTVFVVRYYELSTGKLIGATIAYGYTPFECLVHKAKVDPQPDPEGTKTETSCSLESELPGLLAKGERT